jgi:ABC-type lipoprotein release transport system permease subunit
VGLRTRRFGNGRAASFNAKEQFLNSISSFFLLGFLVLGTIVAATLVSVVKNAEEGFEDESGFHREIERRSEAAG